MQIYEFVLDEIDELLPFRNAVFGHLSLDHWQAMDCTAVVARDEGELVGFIPLQFRQQRLNAQVSIPVVYENAVGVAEGRRRQGIGSQMLEQAAQFMADRVDALFVIRGGERSAGYRFYRKTGHGDLAYARHYFLSPDTPLPDVGQVGIAELDRAQWRALEPQLLALFARQYGHLGGMQERQPGYWDRIFDGHVYRERQWQRVVLRRQPDRLDGYMVAARGTHTDTDELYVYEIAGVDEDAVRQLVAYARQLSENGAVVIPSVTLGNPLRPLLRRLGCQERDSSPYIMARILRPDRIFRRLAQGSDLLTDLALMVNTPHRSCVVNEPPNPRYTVTVDTKEGVLLRLFCCRLDLEAAVEMEMVRWNVHDPGLGRELAQALAFCEWVQWFTDFV